MIIGKKLVRTLVQTQLLNANFSGNAYADRNPCELPAGGGRKHVLVEINVGFHFQCLNCRNNLRLYHYLKL